MVGKIKEIVVEKQPTETRHDTLKVFVNNNLVTLKISSYDDAITLTVDELIELVEKVKF